MSVEAILRAYGELGYRERRVLSLRYGVDGQGGRTLETVAAMHNVTPARVRQIERQAIRKLEQIAGQEPAKTENEA